MLLSSVKEELKLLYNPLMAIPIVFMLLSPSGEISEWRAKKDPFIRSALLPSGGDIYCTHPQPCESGFPKGPFAGED